MFLVIRVSKKYVVCDEKRQKMSHRNDYDSPWKEAIEDFFPEFMAFYFPDATSQIDWEIPVEFLDKEFQQIVREADQGRMYVDKLVSVKLLNGDDVWIYIHFEVQAQLDKDFAKRMFTYYYRIFDKYDRPIASMAVLADNDPLWKPECFTRK